jgi:putative nucleotidyltransferase with HDIG domain
MTHLYQSAALPDPSPALGGWHEHVAVPPLPSQTVPPSAEASTGALDSLASLLSDAAPHKFPRLEQLSKARLGIAASLLTALRCKHAETAAHSMRVALVCSMWAAEKKLPADEREAIEVAAVLHDIGKIGVPDHILLKAGKLDDEEQSVVDRHRLIGAEILSSCCNSFKVLDIVCNAPAWYNGRRMRLAGEGQSLPLGARMLAIADAYDSMTTSQVYRPARSHERAIQELFECAGTQFDPQLVQEFESLYRGDVSRLRTDVQNRWLDELNPTTVDLHWQLTRNFARSDALQGQLFQERLWTTCTTR